MGTQDVTWDQFFEKNSFEDVSTEIIEGIKRQYQTPYSLIDAKPKQVVFWLTKSYHVQEQTALAILQTIKDTFKFRFDRACCVESSDDVEKSLLFESIDICELYLNQEVTKQVMKAIFKLSRRLFAEQLRKIKVLFGDEKEAKRKPHFADLKDSGVVENNPENSPIPSSAKPKNCDESDAEQTPVKTMSAVVISESGAHAWIKWNQPFRIFVNDTLLKRYKLTHDEAEKARITFLVGIFIFHELGHWMIQWGAKVKESEIKTLESGETVAIKSTPEGMGEAGEFLEKTVFDWLFGLVTNDKTNEDWTERSQIIGVAVYHSIDDLKNHSIVPDEYIQSVVKHVVEDPLPIPYCLNTIEGTHSVFNPHATRKPKQDLTNSTLSISRRHRCGTHMMNRYLFD